MRTRDLSVRAAAMLAAILFAGSCSDPVREDAISELGPEAPEVPVGPLHRAGQPCVLCHSDGGPASSKPFAVAGTVFETSDPRSIGARGVEVRFVDPDNFPVGAYTTNEAGNFFVRAGSWPVTYPFRVGIRRGGDPILMSTVVNREGSCNFCHDPGRDPRSSAGGIYLRRQAP